MIGNNELRLNEATMKVAVQEWLATRTMGKAPVVSSVTWDYSACVFVVAVVGPDPKVEGAE